VAADVNGDGHPDLISADRNNKTLTVLTNNGSGGFVKATTYTVGNEPNCVVAADVNGDGHSDLISANSGDNTLSVLFNTPTFSGSFAGDGSGLTGLNAANLTGTVPLAQLPAAVVTNNETGVTLGGTFTATQNINLNGHWLSGDGSSDGVFVDTNGNVGIGTTTPAETLDVKGDIRFGTNSDYYPPGYDRKTVMVAGIVNAAGDPSGSSSSALFTSTESSTGTYVLTFSAGFTADPIVTATAHGSNYASLGAVTQTSAIITVHDDTGALVNAEFNFIAIGAR
jgi:FG-GAP-like repeat